MPARHEIRLIEAGMLWGYIGGDEESLAKRMC